MPRTNDIPQNVAIQPVVQRLAAPFERAGFPLYAVGGQVRNALLGLPISDIDVCAAATPEQIPDILAGESVHIVPIAPEFGSVQIHVDGTVVEYTTFRSDVYGADGQHRPQGVRFADSIDVDAFRRDFSVNAIYAHGMTGRLIDPTGGLADLRKGVLRCTNPDPDRILRDDGLRTLRLVRFAAELGFDIDPASHDSARRHASLLRDIPVERIWQELRKCLLADVRYREDARERPFRSGAEDVGQPAHSRAIQRMDELGMLPYVLPELIEGAGVMQSPRYHAYAVMQHNIMSCAWSAPILSVRLAALLHDIGKPRCLAQNGRMLGHDAVGADMARETLLRLRVDGALVDRVESLVRHHMYDLNSTAKSSTLKRRFAQWGRDLSRELILVREADFLGSGKCAPPIASALRLQSVLDAMCAAHAPFDADSLAISGHDIMSACGIEPGPAVGDIKRWLFLHCAVNPADNNNARLRRLARRYCDTKWK